MKKMLFSLLLLAFTGAANAQAVRFVADGVAAKVGDRIILQSDIRNAVADMGRNGQAAVPANAACMVMEQAVISKVLMLQAEKDSLIVTDEEVEADLDLRIRDFIRAYGSQEALESIAGKTIYQIKDDSRDAVRERKLAEAMQRKIVEGVRITPSEVKTYFERFPADSLPFFESEVELGQIVLYPKATRDLEKYVIDELNNYRRQIEMRVATFEQLVRRYTEDPGSKETGGVYQMNRGDNQWDPSFKAAAFRLKEGEISPVIKSKFGYHLIQLMERNGDDATVRHILRVPPITDDEIKEATGKLDSVRAKLIAGTLDFNTAAGKFTEDEAAKFAGPFIMSRDGDTYLTIDELDKEVVTQLASLKLGEFSQPMVFTDERGKKGVRILYLKSRSEPHRMNLRDDYNRIAQAALEEKKYSALEKWLNRFVPNYFISIPAAETESCPSLARFGATAKGF